MGYFSEEEIERQMMDRENRQDANFLDMKMEMIQVILAVYPEKSVTDLARMNMASLKSTYANAIKRRKQISKLYQNLMPKENDGKRHL